MSVINNLGDEKSPIWIIIDAPYNNDAHNGIIFSGGYGYNFKKTWKLAGLSLQDVYIKSLRPCLGATYITDNLHSSLISDIDTHKPTIIIPMSDPILNYLCPETTQQKEQNSSLRKWAGSLLQSKFILHPHYVIGNQPPDFITMNWDYHEIQAFIDFGHVREEFEYWRQYGTINPLPKRHLITEPGYSDLLGYLNDCLQLSLISVDIETIRPKKGTFYNCEQFKISKHSGLPYTISIAKSPTDAISYSLWDYGAEECVKIWRIMDELLTKVPQIGQNYFLFDSHYLEALGFRICLQECKDTLIRHHILWPGLRHSLQFQTKQYTRQPFYKDEGKNFNIRRKKQFMNYNALDSSVTYEIWQEQEKEFQERPYLI